MKKVLAVMLVLVLCSSLGLAYDKADAKGKMDGKWAKELKLTKTQEKQLAAHKKAKAKVAKKMRADLKKLNDALTKELSKEKVNDAKVSAIAGKIKVLQANKLDNRIGSIKELKKILTPKQFAKMQKMKKSMKDKMKKGMKDRKKGLRKDHDMHKGM